MKILLVLLLAACTVHAQQPDLSSLNWDGSIVYECNSIQSEGLKEVSRFISDGARTVYIGTPIALYTYGVLASATDEPSAANRYAAQTGLQVATALVLTYGIAVGAKNIVNRERPYVAHPDLIVNGEGRVDTHMNSFPSGYTTGTAAVTTTLILRYPKWFVIAPSVGYALLMGFSRMDPVHAPFSLAVIRAEDIQAQPIRAVSDVLAYVHGVDLACPSLLVHL